jgi:hypothetical protein
VNNELKRHIKTGKINNKNEPNDFMKRFVEENNKKGYRYYFEKAYNLMGYLCQNLRSKFIFD